MSCSFAGRGITFFYYYIKTLEMFNWLLGDGFDLSRLESRDSQTAVMIISTLCSSWVMNDRARRGRLFQISAFDFISPSSDFTTMLILDSADCMKSNENETLPEEILNCRRQYHLPTNYFKKMKSMKFTWVENVSCSKIVVSRSRNRGRKNEYRALMWLVESEVNKPTKSV